MRSSLFVLLFLGCLPVFSQGDFRSGYVILADGDSITGKVAYPRMGKNSSSCQFKAQSSRQVITYLPSQIKAYGYFHDRRFETRRLPADSALNSPVFVEVLVKGYMSLLFRNGILYVELHDGKIVSLPPPTQKIVETDHGTYMSKNFIYVGLLNILLADCTLRADDSGYDRTEISYLVQNYNRCHQQPGIYFTETKKKTLFTFQAFGGIQQSRFISSAGKSLSTSVRPMAGISVDLSAPKIFDKLFFSAECVYSRQIFQYYEKFVSSIATEHYDVTVRQTMLKFPISLRYNLRDDSHTFYFKAGVVYGLMLTWKVEEIQEVETSSQVKTYLWTEKFEGKQAGILGSLGFAHGFSNNLKGFVELRFEKMKASGRDFSVNYHNTSLYIFTGVRF
jgi:hypothetical protein